MKILMCCKDALQAEAKYLAARLLFHEMATRSQKGPHDIHYIDISTIDLYISIVSLEDSKESWFRGAHYDMVLWFAPPMCCSSRARAAIMSCWHRKEAPDE